MIPQLNVGGDIAPTDRPKRRRAGEDWIVSMVNALNANNGLRTLMRVVTGPLPEGTLMGRLFGERWNDAFDDDLRLGRRRQIGERQLNDVHRTAPIGTGHFVFRSAKRRRRRCGHPSHGFAAEHDGNRRGLSHSPVAFDQDASMLHRVDPETEPVASLNHAAVDTDINPSLLRVADNDHVCGADVTPPVIGVPTGRRKTFKVNIIILLDALEQRSVLHNVCRNWHESLASVAPLAQQLQRMDIEWQIERQGKPSDPAYRIRADAI